MLKISSTLKLLLTLTLTSLLLTGCFKSEKKINSTKSNTDSNLDGDVYEVTNPGTGTDSGSGDNGDGGGYGDGTEDGVPDAGQTQDYFTISNIIVHSKDHESNEDRDYLWSSQVNEPDSSQNRFVTDSRFNLRVRAQSAPPRGNDSHGEQCFYQEYESWYRYTKLDIEVCLRKSTQSSCTQRHTFEGVPVGQVSKVKEFSVPTTSQPLVIEIVDVRWDTGCLYDRGQSERYCPTYRVWKNDCVKFDVQFSTDWTKDFPSSAPRE